MRNPRPPDAKINGKYTVRGATLAQLVERLIRNRTRYGVTIGRLMFVSRHKSVCLRRHCRRDQAVPILHDDMSR